MGKVHPFRNQSVEVESWLRNLKKINGQPRALPQVEDPQSDVRVVLSRHS